MLNTPPHAEIYEVACWVMEFMLFCSWFAQISIVWLCLSQRCCGGKATWGKSGLSSDCMRRLAFPRIRTSGLRRGVLEKGALDNRLTLVRWNQIMYLTYKAVGKRSWLKMTMYTTFLRHEGPASSSLSSAVEMTQAAWA